MTSWQISLPAACRADSIVAPEYRTFWARFFAFVIDAFVLAPIAIYCIYLYNPSESAAHSFFRDSLLLYSPILYRVIMHARFGRTVGKWMTGIRVYNLSETGKPSLKQALLRDIFSFVAAIASSVALLWLIYAGQNYHLQGTTKTLTFDRCMDYQSSWITIEVIFMFANLKRQAVHDYIAGTVVLDPFYRQYYAVRASAVSQ